MGPKKGKKASLAPAAGEEKVGEKVSELEKEKYMIQIKTLGKMERNSHRKDIYAAIKLML